MTDAPPGPVSPTRMFAALRWRMVRNAFQAIAGRSAIRPVSIVFSSILVWGFVFLISLGGFAFLKQQQFDLGGGVVTMLFDLLFLALSALLVFSTGLILYSSLFNSPEAAFLLSSPAPADHIFAFKFQGALGFSSWAFFLLGSPILMAFGLAYAAPWYFYPFMLIFFAGFLLIPGAVGALCCLLIVNIVPQRKKQLVLLLLLLAAIPITWIIYRLSTSLTHGTMSRDDVERLLGRFELAQAPMLPSHWIAWGLRSAARRNIARSLYYLALVWSNGLFLYLLTAAVAKRLYRRGFNRIATGGALRQRYGGHWLDRLLDRTLFLVNPQTRLLIVKDFRTFRRDPAQWAQILIFAGLMTLYFLNMRKLFIREISWTYQNGLSLLNLCATALLMCTYTGRFIYPMLSLEGKKFWVLGLLPLERDRLLWGKFAFSAVGVLFIAEGLVLLSDLMLEMPATIILLHVLTVAVLAAGLSGLSVGLGACMPNFRETDPSKIAAGFGGTLNLVTGLVFLILTVSLLAGPWHGLASAQGGPPDSLTATLIIGLGVLIGLAAGALAVFLPLYYGIRTLRRMEF